MGQRAIVVIDTDYMANITGNPELFVQALRSRINNSKARQEGFGIRYAAVQHTTSTMAYVVAPSGVRRYHADETIDEWSPHELLSPSMRKK